MLMALGVNSGGVSLIPNKKTTWIKTVEVENRIMRRTEDGTKTVPPATIVGTRRKSPFKTLNRVAIQSGASRRARTRGLV